MVLCSQPGRGVDTHLILDEPLSLETRWTLRELTVTNGPALHFVPIFIHASFVATGCRFVHAPRTEGIDHEDMFDGCGLPSGLELQGRPQGVVQSIVHARFTSCRFEGTGALLRVRESATAELFDCTFEGGILGGELLAPGHIPHGIFTSKGHCSVQEGHLEARGCTFERIHLSCGSGSRVHLQRCDFGCDFPALISALGLDNCQLVAEQCRFASRDRHLAWATFGRAVDVTFRLCDFEFTVPPWAVWKTVPHSPFFRAAGQAGIPLGTVQLQGCLWNGEIMHTTSPWIH